MYVIWLKLSWCVCTPFGSSRSILCLYTFWLKLSCFVYVRHLPRALTLLTCILDVPNLKSAGTPTNLAEGFLAFFSPFPGSGDSFYSDFNVFIVIIQHQSHESPATSLNEMQTSLILRSLPYSSPRLQKKKEV
jgi:hypothetical protein